jgi:hypothetical protein
MSITIPLKTLLGLLDHAMQPVEDKKRETIMLDFINLLDSECDMDRKQAFTFLLELRKAHPEMLWIDVTQERHLPRLGRGVQ